jgi:hypothetical protein
VTIWKSGHPWGYGEREFKAYSSLAEIPETFELFSDFREFNRSSRTTKEYYHIFTVSLFELNAKKEFREKNNLLI